MSSLHRIPILLASFCALLPFQSVHCEPTLEIESSEVAGISGLSVSDWDKAFPLRGDGLAENVDRGEFGAAPSAVWGREGQPGAAAFDAVHRAMLVRFPGAAKQIADQLARGQQVDKVELVLPFRGTELWPIGYNDPAGMSFLGSMWKDSTPRWHAVAYALRQPWTSDPEIGPTFNASIKDRAFWKKFGAQDEAHDRFPTRFGPAEVSAQAQETLDVTEVVTNPAFGKTLGERLALLDQQGFLVKKEEVYDVALWKGGYEWQTARGPQGILVGTPKLRVTFKPGSAGAVGAIPAQPDVKALAAQLAGQPKGRPTATLPSEQEFSAIKEKLSFQKPDYLTEDWQWQRLQELDGLDRERDFPDNYPAYIKWVNEQLARAPRSWYGFDATDVVRSIARNAEAMPAPLLDHWKLFWWAWLLPDRAYDGFDFNGQTFSFAQGYIGGEQAQEYFQKTGDWRGNFSVYRTYVRTMGTMNFNHWATAGVLLGGNFIGSPEMVAEGRKGLETFPLRLWAWFDGSTQESIDHYYFAHSLAAQKVFADFGPEIEDRLMGEAILAKSIEELASAYHPNLRRFQSSSGRTGIAYLLATQDGLQAVMHTLSPEGTLTDLGKETFSAPNAEELKVLGNDFPAGRALQRALDGPWAPIWMSEIIDRKELPFEYTVTYKQWGGFSETPLYKRGYLGENYGLASIDVSVQNETVPVMAQWRHKPEKVSSAADLTTLLIRPGINRTELLDSIFHGGTTRNPNGSVATQGSHIVTMQDKNRAIVLCSPYPELAYDGGRPVPDEVKSLQATAGLMRFNGDSPMKIFVDGKPVTSLPFTAKYGSKITIEDGVSYAALIPIPAAGGFDRDVDIEIVDDGQMTEMQGGGKAREALRINAYLYRSDKPLDKKRADLDLGYMGYVVEVGDAKEYGSFDKFQKHIADTALQTQWKAADKTLEVAYRTGEDTLRTVYRPDYGGNWNNKPPTTELFTVREVNGKWPYPAPGLDRDTPISQQGTTGRLEKNGAVLVSNPGQMTYLVSEPRSGQVLAYNPFSDLNPLDLTLPNGLRLKSDGGVGITRIEANPKTSALDVFITPRSRMANPAAASARFLLFPGDAKPSVRVNDQPATLEEVEVDGKKAFAFALPE